MAMDGSVAKVTCNEDGSVGDNYRAAEWYLSSCGLSKVGPSTGGVSPRSHQYPRQFPLRKLVAGLPSYHEAAVSL